ncbi:MAG TPA: RHS repeat-associated core domain-containing protein [Terriglobales bacterium]|nr:RHS repeat-associated core domain-containing protein [Terriglobales bacterium]
MHGCSFAYDGSGNRTSSTDALGRVTSFTYDAWGNVLSKSQVVNGQTLTWSYTYNGFGQVLTATDPLGNTTTNTYDVKGNLLSTTTPSPDGSAPGSTTSFLYDALGQLTRVTDPLGHQTNITYTTAGLIATVTDANDQVTSFEYDARGNRTAVVDALSNRTTFTYDSRNRLTRITYPDLTHTDFAYDTRGRRTSVTDQNGRVTSYAYDDADRLTSVTDAQTPSPGVTSYAYDTESNLVSITDALGRTTSFTYDAYGRVTKTTFPSTLEETYTYDAVGNLLSKTDRKGQTINYFYDALNRLVSKSYPDSTAVTYTYDNASRLTEVSDPTGTYQFAYDNMGRLTGTTTDYSFLTSRTFTNSYQYDAASNRTRFTDPEGGQTDYVYDVLNRLTSLTNFQAQTFTFGYDALGRRTQLTRPNGVNTDYSYDNLSRLLSVLHKLGAQTIDGATYNVDAVGNRTSKLNHLNGITETYSYDPIYQLTQVIQDGTTTTEAYTYDKAGNRLSSLGVPSYTYNNANQLTATSNATYTYDNNGNTLTKTDASGTTQYAWDYENRLVSVTLPDQSVVTFKYDPMGRRIQKSSASGATNYVYDGSRISEEIDTAGFPLARYTATLAVDEPLAIHRRAISSYVETDGLGSVSSLTDSSGSAIGAYVYDSFGSLTSPEGAVTNSVRYTAREFDTETGLYFYRARYYDPSSSRFISEDPIGFKAGINYYRYVRNNPANFTDPKGLYELKGFPAAEAAQMSIAIGHLAAKLRSNPCCIDPKLRDRVLDLLQPFKPGGVTFVYQQTLPASPGYVTCAHVSDGWDFLTNTVTISQAALNGQCGCGLPGTILHEVVHLTWKNWFGSAPEGGAYGAGSACFGSNCGRPAGLTTP